MLDTVPSSSKLVVDISLQHTSEINRRRVLVDLTVIRLAESLVVITGMPSIVFDIFQIKCKLRTFFKTFYRMVNLPPKTSGYKTVGPQEGCFEDCLAYLKQSKRLAIISRDLGGTIDCWQKLDFRHASEIEDTGFWLISQLFVWQNHWWSSLACVQLCLTFFNWSAK